MSLLAFDPYPLMNSIRAVKCDEAGLPSDATEILILKRNLQFAIQIFSAVDGSMHRVETLRKKADATYINDLKKLSKDVTELVSMCYRGKTEWVCPNESKTLEELASRIDQRYLKLLAHSAE